MEHRVQYISYMNKYYINTVLYSISYHINYTETVYVYKPSIIHEARGVRIVYIQRRAISNNETII